MIVAEKVKLPTPTQAIDALMGDEEQNGKEEKDRNRNMALIHLPWII